MTPDRFTTRPLRAGEQLDAWRQWYGRVFDVMPKDQAAFGFAGETRLWSLDGLVMSRTIAPAARVLRGRAQLKRDPADHWVIGYCPYDTHVASVSGREVKVPAQVPFLWSLRQEILYERAQLDRVQVFLARDTFRDIAHLLDAACGTMLETPLGRLLGDYMIALERRLPDFREIDIPPIINALGAMLAAAVAPSMERAAIAKSPIEFGRTERVRRVVRQHLRTPTLEPKTLSRLVGMSRSNLYRLLEGAGGVARYIQRQRLLEAHAMLCDRTNKAAIGALAEELCFADASSFTRAFKREFGYSPSEARAAAVGGAAPRPIATRSRVYEGSDLGDLLLAF